MPTRSLPSLEICNCQAVRATSRHVTQHYDRCLAPVGLRTSQFTILAKLKRHGSMTITQLAEAMVMDRTTLGRNIQPLERDGLIRVEATADDRRAKQLRLTLAGEKRLEAARKAWRKAQAEFEGAFGAARAAQLRSLLHAVTATELPGESHSAP